MARLVVRSKEWTEPRRMVEVGVREVSKGDGDGAAIADEKSPRIDTSTSAPLWRVKRHPPRTASAANDRGS